MGDQIVISNTKNSESTLLMNMMGQKMAIEVGDQKDNKSESIPSIVYSQESKTIAGYLCKKATYTVFNEEQQDSISMDLYYTTKIPSSYNPQFKELKGIPLEYTINTQGMSMTFEATKVESKKLSKSLFNIPKEYETISLEEFKKMMGQ
jgi:GLPGLI family protein